MRESICPTPPSLAMAIDPITTPPAFAPLVSQLSDAISRQLAEAFAEVEARLDRERRDAVSQAVASQAETSARERDAQVAALDDQIRALRHDYDARLEAQAARAHAEREELEAQLRAEWAAASASVSHDEAGTHETTSLEAAPEGNVGNADASALDAPTQTRIVERELALAASARLLAAFERFDAAQTLRDTLDALAESVAAEVARVMVFVVRGTGLRGWRFIGISDAPSEASDVAIGREFAGPLQATLVDRAACEVLASELANAVPALGWIAPAGGDEPMAGMAVPLVVDHEAVALVYCDDGLRQDRNVPAAWPEVVQVLVRHASVCLEAHTARRAAGFARLAVVPASSSDSPDRVSMPAAATAADIEAARRFARLVVSELKLYNESAVIAGREARDLRVRLRDELARARRLYEARVPALLPDRDDYFDQEVVRTLADGDATLLGDAATSAA